ncbi:hypothetical protein Ga0102493_111995 [Erythrobacter litoralis]|jgi:hypothetical protein|uniref:PepSY domain-containing protein n=1 Tax=Erythrobacter litoralis TaxID=39960 RepID=A0A074MK21_9SPHN|nr:hypothetical protein [Erythrobacter litoralis]AOL23014.1 hypothetical protein Ga0102493_111995 [Erythrobacter litoralis]KEO93120.1 hypothetical protein EH32_12905 [Erythrobacter litoralis]MEE4338441.1 hypothetical protein [Erythrobacter sp.]
MKTATACALLASALLFSNNPLAAQAVSEPGVTEPVPGVRVIDGSKVSQRPVSSSALLTAIAADPGFKGIAKLLGGKGIESPGPQGTVTHMYKIRETDSDTDKVVVLFVKGGKVVEHLIT